jgi:RNA polymerase sigma-70 factor (ECF subfamily)
VSAAAAEDHGPPAWAEIYENARDGLYRYARRRLASDHAADDAVSETMARAIHGIDRLAYVGAGAGVRPWLYGILRNVVNEQRRTAVRTVGWGVVDPAPPEPVEHVLAGEEAAVVRRAFDRLGPDERELLSLRVVAGLSAADVARAQGRSAGAVRMAQKRALGRLRRMVEHAVQ